MAEGERRAGGGSEEGQASDWRGDDLEARGEIEEEVGMGGGTGGVARDVPGAIIEARLVPLVGEGLEAREEEGDAEKVDDVKDEDEDAGAARAGEAESAEDRVGDDVEAILRLSYPPRTLRLESARVVFPAAPGATRQGVAEWWLCS